MLLVPLSARLKAVRNVCYHCWKTRYKLDIQQEKDPSITVRSELQIKGICDDCRNVGLLVQVTTESREAG